MANNNVIVLNRMNGGLNKLTPLSLGAHEASRQINLAHSEGNLRTIPGRTALAKTTGDRISNFVSDAPVDNVDVWSVTPTQYHTSGVFNLFVQGNFLWADLNTTAGGWPVLNALPILELPWMPGNPCSLVYAGDRLYIAPLTGVYGVGGLWRWDAFVTGFAAMLTGNGTTTVSMDGGLTDLLGGGSVQPGDTVYGRVYSGGAITGTTFVKLGQIQSIPTPGVGVWTMDTAVPSGTYIFSVSRIHRAGISAPYLPVTGAASAGGGLEVGTYQYAYRDECSWTGAVSNLVPLTGTVTTTSGNQRVTVAFPAGSLYPTDLQVDRRRLYRTVVGGSSLFEVATIDRDQAGYRFPATYLDYTPDSAASGMYGEGVALGPLAEDGHDPPPEDLTSILLFNDRIYGVRQNSNIGSMSNINDLESWPENDWSQNTASTVNPAHGGFYQFGSASSPIMDMIPEGGSIEGRGGLGVRGGNLLILKADRQMYRWYGYSYEDFAIDSIAGEDCVSPAIAQAQGGKTYWISSKGLVALPNGMRAVERLYDKMHPVESANWLTKFDRTGAPYRIRTGIWGDNLLISYAEGDYFFGQWQNRLMVYHIPSNTWAEWGYDGSDGPTMNIRSFAVSEGFRGHGALYMGDSFNSTVWRLNESDATATLFDGVLPIEWVRRTGLIATPPSAIREEATKTGQLNQVRVLVRNPGVDTSITLKLYTNRNTAVKAQATKTVLAAGDGMQWLNWSTTTQGWGFELEISGSTSVPLYIEEIRMAFAPAAKQN